MISAYPWQLKDVQTIVDNHFVAPLVVETGGTKTAISTLAAKEMDPRIILISAPESAHNTAWVPTMGELAGREVRRVGNGLKAHKVALQDLELGRPGTYITTPQFASRYDTSNWFGDLLINDEAHRTATAKSAGQRAFSGFDSKDKMKEPLSRRFEGRLALSGTPMRQDFANMWSMMRFLWWWENKRHEVAYDNFWMWQADRMESIEVFTNQKDFYGNTKKVKQFLHESNPGQLLSEMPCYVMHKMRENCCEYHPNGFMTTERPLVIERIVALSPKQKKYIAELEKHYITWIEEHPLAIDLPMVMQQRIRQICLGEPRVETFLAFNKEGEEVEKETLEFDEDCISPFLEEAIDIITQLPETENVVVYLTSQRFASVMVNRLNKVRGITAQEYSGRHKADLTKFGQDYRVLVGQVSAMGAGTDGLQHVCNTEIWMEQPVSLTDKTQAEARLDRIGGQQVQRYILLDDEGRMEGRMGDLLGKTLAVRASLRERN